MKYFLIITLSIIFLACENTDEPAVTTPYHISGNVNLRISRTHETGKELGTFSPLVYLSGIRCELLSDGKVIQTTYTKPDESWDSYYVFDNVEPEGKYQVRVHLNSFMKIITDEFNLTKESFSMCDTNTTDSLFNLRPDYFKPGQYYYMALIDTLHGNFLNFIVDKSNKGIFPNPFTEKTNFTFDVMNKDSISLDLCDIKLNNISNIVKNQMEAGSYMWLKLKTYPMVYIYCGLQ